MPLTSCAMENSLEKIENRLRIMILLSSCLAGFNVRYDGGNAANALAMWLVERGQALSVCPEVISGLPTPREACEISDASGAAVLDGNARVLDRSGSDLSQNFIDGANVALNIALRNHVTVAFLKDKSPSCGVSTIYDGSFTGTKISGMGVTAALLHHNGIDVFPDTDLTIESVLPHIEESLRPQLLADFG